MSCIGREVLHYKWGKGLVKAQRYGDFELLVRFNNGVITWLKKGECNLLLQKPETIITMHPPTSVIPTPTEFIEEEILIRRQAIEAFKLGIIPHFVKDFIFGRDREIEYIKKWLNQDEQNYLLIFGAYGSGKTHLMKYIQHMALEMDYAVASSSLDPEETPLYHPKSVYRSIVSNLTFNHGKEGFKELIKQINEKHPQIGTDNLFLDIILHHSMNDNLFWRWLEGGDLIKSIYGFPSLYPWSTAANIFCNLLSIYGHLARRLLGLKGLLLLFDEAETLNFPSYYQYQYQRGKNLFRGLLLASSNDHRLLHEEITPSNPRTGLETDLIYCGRNTIKYIYHIPTGLKVIFTLTPSEEITRFCRDIGYNRAIPLERLGDEDREEVVDAIQKLYILAYPTSKFKYNEMRYIKRRAIEIGVENIRSLIKSTIEAMDLRRHWPEKDIKEILS